MSKPLDPSLVAAVEEFIAGHDMRNHHPLLTSEIVAAFPNQKPKTIKRIVHELR